MIYEKDIEMSEKDFSFFVDGYKKAIKTQDVLFFDVETAPRYEKLIDAPDKFQELWKGKADTLRKFSNQYSEDMSDEEIYNEGAGLFAEYNRIVCVSFGKMDDKREIKTVSFVGSHVDEEQREEWIIKNAFAFIATQMKGKSKFISGANITGFDVPNLLKKGLKYGYHIDPKIFINGQKPWEGIAKDLQEDWKRGVLRDARLESICYFLGIGSPKDEMNGSMVAEYYYNGRIEDIAAYCEQDVIKSIEVFNYLQNLKVFV